MTKDVLENLRKLTVLTEIAPEQFNAGALCLARQTLDAMDRAMAATAIFESKQEDSVVANILEHLDFFAELRGKADLPDDTRTLFEKLNKLNEVNQKQHEKSFGSELSRVRSEMTAK